MKQELVNIDGIVGLLRVLCLGYISNSVTLNAFVLIKSLLGSTSSPISISKIQRILNIIYNLHHSSVNWIHGCGQSCSGFISPKPLYLEHLPSVAPFENSFGHHLFLFHQEA